MNAMAPAEPAAGSSSSTLYFGPWYRRSPFFERTLERLAEPQEADYIGKAAVEEIRQRGASRKLVGIESPGAALPFEIADKRPAHRPGTNDGVGTVPDLIWSPRLERNIGYVWVPIELAGAGNGLEIEAPNGSRWPARTAAIPFLDARKDIPKQ